MNILRSSGIEYDNVPLLLSDAALYMIKTGVLNIFYLKMIYVTWVVHELHRVREEVRSQFITVDKVILSIKIIFRKASSNLFTFFLNRTAKLKFISGAIFESWINATIYNCKKFETIHRIILMLNKNNATSIKDV